MKKGGNNEAILSAAYNFEANQQQQHNTLCTNNIVPSSFGTSGGKAKKTSSKSKTKTKTGGKVQTKTKK